MARTIAIGVQDFADLIKNQYFYVDKTSFIKEWWKSGDSVTLIARPRRFGKTLNMSMLEYFFSVDHADSRAMFENLRIWNDEKYRELQGSFPVISLSFANVKETCYADARKKICQMLAQLYADHAFLLKSNQMTQEDRRFFERMTVDMDDVDAAMAIHYLSKFLYMYYGKKVIILLDEYDTPMQEAYLDGYWDELVAFTRGILNAAFKTNPWLERAVMTGITRVSKESIFSDLNNLKVVTSTSDEYTDAFGFTQDEVENALAEYGLSAQKEKIKQWYDGFVFGNQRGIYNPWSILNFLDTKKYRTYWANTSSNGLVGKLVREGNRRIKEKFEKLMQGEWIESALDEQVVYSQLDGNERAMWSLMLAGGYLKAQSYADEEEHTGGLPVYRMAITNFEVKLMFENLIHDWFSPAEEDYNDFIRALLAGNKKEMNAYMNRVALAVFSTFDTGKRPSQAEPERFYHGFVLGLLVDLQGRYLVLSNRESGFGRYDVMLEPKDPKQDDAVILEFKVHDPHEEKTLEDTVQSALLQIKEKNYEKWLVDRGIPRAKIRNYGFAFEGKRVLIG